MNRSARRAARRAAGSAGRARLDDQAGTRQRLADAVAGWLRLSKAGDLGPVTLPVGTFTDINESGRTVRVELTATITPLE